MIKVFDFETCKKIGTKLSSENFFDWVDFALKNKTDFQMPIKSRMSQDHGITMLVCLVCMKMKILQV